MKNEKLDTALRFLENAGITGVTEGILTGLFAAIKDKRELLYEKSDFVAFYEGMGEMGHGTVLSRSGNNYRIQVWLPPESTYSSYATTVTSGDMRGISSPEEAMKYYLVRSGQV